MKAVDKLSENILDKLSIDFLRSQVLKNAYGNNDTVIAAMDPRVLIVWYLFFGLVPWFVSDLPFLLGCFVLVTATTILAHVAGLVLFLFGLGVFSQTGYLLVVTWLFGGDASAIAPLLLLALKVATVSLASDTVFSGMDPDKLANGLMWFGCPEQPVGVFGGKGQILCQLPMRVKIHVHSVVPLRARWKAKRRRRPRQTTAPGTADRCWSL